MSMPREHACVILLAIWCLRTFLDVDSSEVLAHMFLEFILRDELQEP